MLRHLALALNLVAIAVFFPGICLPMFKLNMELIANLGVSTIGAELLNKELSILATVEELWQESREFVAFLIALFSIGVPLLKTTLSAVAYFQPGSPSERKLVGFVANIGKWSMADVFVVAIFLAFLSTTHAGTMSQQTLTLFGFNLGIQISTETLSAVGPGFYYFTGYCLVSLVATQLYQWHLRPAVRR